MPDAAGARFQAGRHAGVILPLFSMPTRRSWGIGEIADLPVLARWLESAGLDFLQLLPVNEMSPGQSSPYSALSAMAIDPIFIAIDDVEEFQAAGGWQTIPREEVERIEAARAAPRVDYAVVRACKRRALETAFGGFARAAEDSPRVREFEAFRGREAWWLEDYGLFRALYDEQQGRYWREWEPGLRDRDAESLAQARGRLAGAIRFYEYAQWIADTQWQRARRDCGRVGIAGDFPFMVSGQSADVWARQHEFRHDASVGTPPDAFSETGQDWGLPVPRWDVMAAGGYEWFAQRARRTAAIFELYRVDHLIGFYRTFVRERDGHSWFSPPDEASETAQGEALLSVFDRSGPRIIAEDLGVVPDFVRASLRRLGVPGMKVLRWEREWKQQGKPFRDPAKYPAASAAISGTHDTETQAEWWEVADDEERAAVASIPAIRERRIGPADPFVPGVRDALIRALYRSGSDFVILAFPDLFGWRDRINTPASVSEDNWTWRLPWPADEIADRPEARERAAFLHDLAHESARG
jgi:4-alpha-glucanotransferase